MDFDGELVNLISHIIRQVLGDMRVAAVGHVVDYDPKLHAIRLSMPSYPVVDGTGTPTGEFAQTGWLQLVTLEGHQTAPHPGDAAQLTGDQYHILLLEKGEGTAIVVGRTYNDVSPSPFTDLQPGEWGYKNRDSNSFVRAHKNGDHEHQITGKVTIQQTTKNSNIVLNTDGSIVISGLKGTKISMNAGGNVIITGSQGQTITLDDSTGNVVIAPESGASQVVLGGGSLGIPVARIGDRVTVDGTPGGTQVGKIATGSTKVQAN